MPPCCIAEVPRHTFHRNWQEPEATHGEDPSPECPIQYSEGSGQSAALCRQDAAGEGRIHAVRNVFKTESSEQSSWLMHRMPSTP